MPSTPHEHPHRPEIAKRMSRIAGHAVSIRKMLETERGCDEILQQMTAVIRAVESARQAILEDHLETCIASAVRDGQGAAAVEELRKTLKLAFR